MEALRAHFHLIDDIIGVLGLVLVAAGGLRVVRAPSLAAKRASLAPDVSRSVASATDVAAVDLQRLARNAPDRSRGGGYARGLTDFYRISGTLTALAGVVLLIIAFVAW